MNNEQLQYFEAVYEHRSFAKAASVIHITPQGMAKAIHSLESELKAELFVPSVGGAEPTAEAERLHQFAQRFHSSYEKLLEDIAAIHRGYGTRIVVGTATGLQAVLGQRFLDALREELAPTSLEFVEVPDSTCDEMLDAEKVDVAFTVAPFDGGFETVPLGAMEFGLWVRDDDSLAAKSGATVADLAGRVLMTPQYGFKNYKRLMEKCDEAGVWPVAVEGATQVHRIADFVRSGQGVSLTVEFVANQPAFKDAGLVPVPLEDMYLTFGLSWAKDMELSGPQQRFIDTAKSLWAQEQSPWAKRLAQLEGATGC